MKKVLLILFPVLFVSATFDVEKFTKIYEESKGLIQSGQYSRAIDILRPAYASSGHAQFAYKIACSFKDLCMLDSAKKYAKMALDSPKGLDKQYREHLTSILMRRDCVVVREKKVAATGSLTDEGGITNKDILKRNAIAEDKKKADAKKNELSPDPLSAAAEVDLTDNVDMSFYLEVDTLVVY